MGSVPDWEMYLAALFCMVGIHEAVIKYGEWFTRKAASAWKGIGITGGHKFCPKEVPDGIYK